MTPVPLFTLFALEALLDLKATISNNVKGGTILGDAGGAMELRWHPDRARGLDRAKARYIRPPQIVTESGGIPQVD